MAQRLVEADGTELASTVILGEGGMNTEQVRPVKNKNRIINKKCKRFFKKESPAPPWPDLKHALQMQRFLFLLMTHSGNKQTNQKKLRCLSAARLFH